MTPTDLSTLLAEQLNEQRQELISRALFAEAENERLRTLVAQQREALRPLAEQDCESFCFPESEHEEPHDCAPEKARAVLAQEVPGLVENEVSA